MSSARAIPSKEAPDRAAWTRGLSDVLLLADNGQALSAHIASRVGDAQLTTNTSGVILARLALDGPLRPRDLVETTQLTSSGLTKQLDHLENLGLVRRSSGTLKDDRRASVVAATPEGERTAGEFAAAVESFLEDTRSMSRDLAALLEA
jgi:DNA-binding MarR family transcriptional regulator